MTQRLYEKIRSRRVEEYWQKYGMYKGSEMLITRNARICESLRPPIYEQQVRLETRSK